MRKIITLSSILAALFLLAGCAGGKPPATRTVEDYLQALVEKDEARLVSLSCTSWEADALLELDAFDLVKTSLDGLNCQQTGQQEEDVLVTCQGKIKATYGTDVREFDLSKRVYRVQQEKGDLRVCGY